MVLKLNSELRAQARESLKGNWSDPVLITLIYLLISVGSNIPYLGICILIFIILPIDYSYQVAFLSFFRDNKKNMIAKLFNCFKDYTRIIGTTLLKTLYVLLWILLLIVPGIVKIYSYAMTYYISIEHSELTAEEAIQKSMLMMKGHKMKLFLLDLSFIGWIVLSILTLGIGFLWLYPYMQTAHAAFYEDLKKAEEEVKEEA